MHTKFLKRLSNPIPMAFLQHRAKRGKNSNVKYVFGWLHDYLKDPPLEIFFKMLILAFEADSAFSYQNGLFSTF